MDDGNAEVSEFLQIHLLSLGSVEVTVGALVGCVVLIATLWLLAELSCRAVEHFLPKERVHLRSLLRRIIRIGVWVIGILASLETLGFDLGTVLATSAIFSLGVGLAMQQITRSILAGFMLLGEREIVPGDVVRYDDRVVRVKKIGLRTTVLATRLGGSIIVPNDRLAQNPLENLTFDDKPARFTTEVSVAYGSDLNLAKRVLEKTVRGTTGSLPDDCLILLDRLGEYAVVFKLVIALSDPFAMPMLQSRVLFSAYRELQKEGIAIPFPQLDVRLQEPQCERRS